MKELLNNDALLAITERLLGKKIGKDNIYKIQQAGTKYVGHVYFDVADDFLYECIVQTTGTTNTTANFKKIGTSDNRDKLDNLPNGDYDIIVEKTVSSGDVVKIPNILNYKAIGTINRYNSVNSYIPISKFTGKNRICIFTRGTNVNATETGLVDASFTDHNTIRVSFVGRSGGTIDGYDKLILIGYN